jgi:hypothetical protein
MNMLQILCIQQVLDSRAIVAPVRQSRFGSLAQLMMTMLLRQLEQIDHLPGPTLLSMPLDERSPDLIEAWRPHAGLTLLLQRFRSR